METTQIDYSEKIKEIEKREFCWVLNEITKHKRSGFLGDCSPDGFDVAPLRDED